jgi:hypothetical protein
LTIGRAKTKNDEQENEHADYGERAKHNNGNAKPTIALKGVVAAGFLLA